MKPFSESPDNQFPLFPRKLTWWHSALIDDLIRSDFYSFLTGKSAINLDWLHSRGRIWFASQKLKKCKSSLRKQEETSGQNCILLLGHFLNRFKLFSFIDEAYWISFWNVWYCRCIKSRDQGLNKLASLCAVTWSWILFSKMATTFLFACTRLHPSRCRSVGLSVYQLVG